MYEKYDKKKREHIALSLKLLINEAIVEHLVVAD